MQTPKTLLLSLFTATWALAMATPAAASNINDYASIRPPAVSGSYYPATANDLDTILTQLFEPLTKKTFSKQSDGRLLSVITPHAGFIYSGEVAAYTFREVSVNGHYDTYIIIGDAHKNSFSGISVYNEGAWRTPFGLVEVDKEAAQFLLDNDIPGLTATPEYHKGDHVVEMQLPFLQKIDKDFKILPLIVGKSSYPAVEKLSKVIAAYMRKNKRVLLIASTDLSHYHSYKSSVVKDRQTISTILKNDPFAYFSDLNSGKIELCGPSAVMTALIVGRNMGKMQSFHLHRANSGDTLIGKNSKNGVVGYTSIVSYLGGSKLRHILSAKDKTDLLTLARNSLEATANGKKYAPVTTPPSAAMLEQRGAFVTINKNGRLRGCIGIFEAQQPLYQVVIEMAKSAASNDNRFPAITPAEIPELELEISVLTPLELIDDPQQIQVGLHGIYLVKGTSRGVLLPQVATDYGWDRETFLDQTCLKAGLARGAWKDKDCKIYTFSAEIFAEPKK